MDYQNSLESIKNERMESAIEYASELFLLKGIENVKMTDIAKASGIGVASLYRYFVTKTSIVIRVGIYEWEKVRGLFDDIFHQAYYENKTGYEQISQLLSKQVVLFSEHKDFLRFLYEFDTYMIKEKVPKNELAEYESSIMNIYPLFERAYAHGISDGTLRPDMDFKLVYKSLTHALMNLCQRFVLGEILPSDDFSTAEDEVKLIISMILEYIKSK